MPTPARPDRRVYDDASVEELQSRTSPMHLAAQCTEELMEANVFPVERSHTVSKRLSLQNSQTLGVKRVVLNHGLQRRMRCAGRGGWLYKPRRMYS